MKLRSLGYDPVYYIPHPLPKPERNFIKTIEHPHHGAVELPGSPIRLSASDVPLQAAPLLGQHTAEVVTEDLGLDDREVAALRESGAID